MDDLVHDLFAAADSDGNGAIDAAELQATLRALPGAESDEVVLQVVQKVICDLDDYTCMLVSTTTVGSELAADED